MTRWAFALTVSLAAGCRQVPYAELRVEQESYGESGSISRAAASFRAAPRPTRADRCDRIVYGDCTLVDCPYEWGGGDWTWDSSEPVVLDAGEVRFAADGAAYRLDSLGTSDDPDSDTFYALDVAPIAGGATIAFEATGNVVPSFYVASTMPPQPVVTLPDALPEGVDLEIGWTAITDGSTLEIQIVENGWAWFTVLPRLVCTPPADAGSLTIPAEAVARLVEMPPPRSLSVRATAVRVSHESRPGVDLSVALRNEVAAWIER